MTVCIGECCMSKLDQFSRVFFWWICIMMSRLVCVCVVTPACLCAFEDIISCKTLDCITVKQPSVLSCVCVLVCVRSRSQSPLHRWPLLKTWPTWLTATAGWSPCRRTPSSSECTKVRRVGTVSISHLLFSDGREAIFLSFMCFSVVFFPAEGDRALPSIPK